MDKLKKRNKEGRKIFNKETQWYVVNLKAFKRQEPQHYLEALDLIVEEDPLVQARGNRYMSIRNIQKSEELDKTGIPLYVIINLCAYDILDQDAFYNIKEKEDITVSMNPDIVANKKETEIIYIPLVHKLAFSKSSRIALGSVCKFFQEALDVVEDGGFDVNAVSDRDYIKEILSSEIIYYVEANISYSNRSNSSGFQETLDEKLRQDDIQKATIILKGSDEHPLLANQDGIVDAIAGIAESDGSFIAKIRKKKNSKKITVNTKDHPLVLRIPQIIGSKCKTIYNELRTRYGQNT